MLAAMTKNPLFDIEQSEAATLAKAMKGVADFYPMKASAETLAWVNLAMALGSVYGTRIMALRVIKQAEASPPPANVSLFPGHIAG